MNDTEKFFLQEWQKKDFSDWNESDIREEFITPLLRILGYARDTVYEIIREKSLKLKNPFQRVGRKRIKIDYIPQVRLKRFWIIEAKPGTLKEMEFGDLLQTYLYATHPEVRGRFIVLINGWSIRIYETESFEKWEDTLHICNQDNCFQTFEKLLKILKADSLLDFHRSRLLDTIKENFSIEIDEKKLAYFRRDVGDLLLKMKKIVKKNAIKVTTNEIRTIMEQEKKDLRKMNPKQLLVNMNIPTYPFLPPADEFFERIRSSNTKDQKELLDQLIGYYRGKPHAILRIQALHVLARCLEEKVEPGSGRLLTNIKDMFKDLVLSNISYWNTNELSFALCHLDNTTLRFAKKLAFILYMSPLTEVVVELKKQLSVEDRLKESPSVAKYMIPKIGKWGEILWRDFFGAVSADDIWEGIWLIEYAESLIATIPVSEYPDGNSDLLFFEFYGKQFDMLCYGTNDVLKRHLKGLSSINLSQEVQDFAALEHGEIYKQIPLPKRPPEDWKPSIDKNKNKKIVLLINILLKLKEMGLLKL
ncbi:MAG: hypothetical protein HWN65_10185 [Candidatus Helarchaeota archaeon]|nr:hypothetical protein [Candidatus Helarchaeota archaeon]